MSDEYRIEKLERKIEELERERIEERNRREDLRRLLEQQTYALSAQRDSTIRGDAETLARLVALETRATEHARLLERHDDRFVTLAIVAGGRREAS